MKITAKRVRLGVGWALIPPYLILAQPSRLLIIAGAVLALGGILVRAWAAGTIRKNASLAVGGPYAYTRNPLYLGSFLIGLGLAVAGGRPELLAVFIILFAVLYGRAMRDEVGKMERLFGDDYRTYARDVPLFIPRLNLQHRRSARSAASFRLERYLKNREYEAALGVLLGFLALTLKMTWL